MDLPWDATPVTLKDAIADSRLPVVAKVNEACEIGAGKSLKKGELLTIHGRRTVIRFHGFDSNGSEVFVPANSGLKARLRVPADSAVFDTVKDICLETPAPKFVEIIQDREYGGGQQSNTLNAGDRLKVLLVERNGDGPTHMHFRNQFGKHVRLSADFEGPFKPCSENNQIHSLADLARQPLPFTIEIAADEFGRTSCKLKGIVQIIDILSEDIALASVKHKKIYAVVLPVQHSVSVLLPENQNNSIYEELTEAQSSQVDVDLIQGYVDQHSADSKSSSCYTPYESLSQVKPTKKEKRLSTLKTASLGHRHDLKLLPIKAASKLLKSRKKTPSEEEDGGKAETKTKVFKSKSLRKFKDKRRKKSETAEQQTINEEQVPQSPDSEDRCSVTSSPSPHEDRKMTSVTESEDELRREDSRESDADDYEDPLPSPVIGSKSKTNTLIGRMWKKMKAQKTKSAGSMEETGRDGCDNKTASPLISGELYEALDDSLYEEIEGQLAYESLDLFQEARRTMGLPPTPATPTVESSGDSGFVDFQQRPGGRHANSPLPPLPPNHPLEKRSYSAEDLYEIPEPRDTMPQVDASQFEAFYEALKKSEQEICEWGLKDVASTLNKLQLARFVTKFQDSQIDGTLLIGLDEAVFKDFGMTAFQSRKLRKFVYGWRPDSMKDGKMTLQSMAKDDDPSTWNEAEVSKRLTSIGMSDIARFCKANQVNGDLLKDVVIDDDIMNEVVSGGDKRLKLIKLRNYVLDAWRPRMKSDASSISNPRKLKKIQTEEIDIGERKLSSQGRKASDNGRMQQGPASSTASSGSRIASIKQQLLASSS